MHIDLWLQVEGLEHHPAYEPSPVDGSAVIAGIPLDQWQTWIETWLQCLDPKQSPIDSYELSLLLTNDAEICALNTTYRQQNKATDVLAFAALEAPAPVQGEMEFPLALGDIIISVETATQQAIAAHHSLSLELPWLASHGLLHLLGWDHPDHQHLEYMLLQQDKLMHAIGLASPPWSLAQWNYEDSML
jgi:probable rRNA maturation factor